MITSIGNIILIAWSAIHGPITAMSLIKSMWTILETDKYLDNRGKTVATDSSGNNSVSENLVENSDGLSVDLLHNVSMALKKLSRMFGDDLEEMFMNRW